MKVKPIIGIVSNRSFTKDRSIIYEDIVKMIELAGGEPIALVSTIDDKVGDNVLSMCDGFLFQGGHEINSFKYQMLEYAIKNNKPVLGICRGFQLIAQYFLGTGSIVTIDELNINISQEHNDNDETLVSAHLIKTEPNTILRRLYGPSRYVNSRHMKTAINIKEPLMISAKCKDGLVEGIEWVDQEQWLVGVLWHPENMEVDLKLFQEFILECKKRSKR